MPLVLHTKAQTLTDASASVKRDFTYNGWAKTNYVLFPHHIVLKGWTIMFRIICQTYNNSKNFIIQHNIKWEFSIRFRSLSIFAHPFQNSSPISKEMPKWMKIKTPFTKKKTPDQRQQYTHTCVSWTCSRREITESKNLLLFRLNLFKGSATHF